MSVGTESPAAAGGRTRYHSAASGVGILLLVLAACSDSPAPLDAPDAQIGLAPTLLNQVQDVPALEVDLPAEPQMWENGGDALLEALEAQDGYGVIAFKNPVAARLGTERFTREVFGRQHTRGMRAAVSSASIRAGLELLEELGVEVRGYMSSIGAAAVQIPTAAVPILHESPLIDYIAPRQQGRLDSQATDWGITKIKAPAAWTVTEGSGATILIIDSGHQQNHEDLPSIPTQNCGGAYGGCSDGAQTGWHGTHVTGIALMRNNSVGYVGVARALAGSDAHVWGACHYDVQAEARLCDSDEVALGLNYAAAEGIDVVNMSLSYTFSPTEIANTAAAALDSGVVMVASAGNSVSEANRWPAALSQVIGVAGVNEDGSFAEPFTTPSFCEGGFSNSGSHVDLAAPFYAWSSVGPNTYARNCGNSISTPHVAGVAALVRAKLPHISPDSVRQRLINTAVPGPVWDANSYGAGIVDAAGAIDLLTVSMTGPGLIDTEGMYEWEAFPSGGEGSYSYQWQAKDGSWGPNWVNLGTDKSQSLYVQANDGNFKIRVIVTAVDAQVKTQERNITNNIGGCGSPGNPCR